MNELLRLIRAGGIINPKPLTPSQKLLAAPPRRYALVPPATHVSPPTGPHRTAATGASLACQPNHATGGHTSPQSKNSTGLPGAKFRFGLHDAPFHEEPFEELHGVASQTQPHTCDGSLLASARDDGGALVSPVTARASAPVPASATTTAGLTETSPRRSPPAATAGAAAIPSVRRDLGWRSACRVAKVPRCDAEGFMTAHRMRHPLSASPAFATPPPPMVVKTSTDTLTSCDHDDSFSCVLLYSRVPGPALPPQFCRAPTLAFTPTASMPASASPSATPRALNPVELSAEERRLLVSLRASASMQPWWPNFDALFLDFACMHHAASPLQPQPLSSLSCSHATEGASCHSDSMMLCRVGPAGGGGVQEGSSTCCRTACRPLSVVPTSDDKISEMSAKVRRLVRGASVKQVDGALRNSGFNVSRAIDSLKAELRSYAAASASTAPTPAAPAPHDPAHNAPASTALADPAPAAPAPAPAPAVPAPAAPSSLTSAAVQCQPGASPPMAMVADAENDCAGCGVDSVAGSLQLCCELTDRSPSTDIHVPPVPPERLASPASSPDDAS